MATLGLGEHCAAGRQYDDGHDAHMELNGECPWCGAYDQALAERELSEAQVASMIADAEGTLWL